jgi:hypothetical protein
VGREQLNHLLAEDGAHAIGGADALLARRASDACDQQGGDADADIGGDEHLLELLEQLVGGFTGAGEKVGDSAEEIAEQGLLLLVGRLALDCARAEGACPTV